MNKIIAIVEENICTLRETLANFQRMPVKGVDKRNAAYKRKVKKEFVAQTKIDIEYMLTLRKKLITQNK